MNHQLTWGGLFKGKPARSVEIEPPASGAIMLIDRFRSKPITFLKNLLAESTRSIEGQRVDAVAALAFWGSVKYQDAQVASVAMIRENWPDEEANEQEVQCAKGHITQHAIKLSQFHVTDTEKGFEITCKPWSPEKELTISQMRFELETIDQIEQLQEYLGDEKFNEMLLRKIAMCCTLPEHPDRQLSLAHVIKMPAPLRKRISDQFRNHRLIDLAIRGRCEKCQLTAEGVLNIVDFL